MSRSYENAHRVHNGGSDFRIDKTLETLNPQHEQAESNKFIYRRDEQNPRYQRNEDAYCENNDETNLFYSFQMQVDESEARKNANKYHPPQQLDQPAYHKLEDFSSVPSRTQFDCDKCEKSFPSKQSLNAHAKIFHSESSVVKNSDGSIQHECEYCHKLFSQATGLLEHKRIHTGEKPYECKICQKTFSRSIYLNVHMRCHTGEKPYTCKTCNKAFTQKKSLSTHARIHTGEKPFGCSQCDKTFARSYYLRIHMRSHTGEKPFACTLCSKSFTQKQSLSVHLKTHVGDKSPRKRRSSKKEISEPETILTHDEHSLDESCYTPNGVILPDSQDHSMSQDFSETPARQLIQNAQDLPPPLTQLNADESDLSPNVIDVDSEPEEEPTNLKQVMPVPREFSSISRHFLSDFFPRHHLLELSDSSSPPPEQPITQLLPGQIKLQPNGKPYEYPCKDCGEGFPNLRDLALHERTHTGLYKYQCKYCSKAFRKSYNLRLHVRSHTGEKPYQCTECGKWFSQSSSLLVHTKTHLREKEENAKQAVVAP